MNKMNPNAQFPRFLADEEATLAFGGSLATVLDAPLVIYLQGDLGAGKTTFTRGLLRGLGHAGSVKSPTYAIVESYPLSGKTVHHFDLYRFTAPQEWEDAGLDDLLTEDSVCLIEWPQQGEGFAPAADLSVRLENVENGRSCSVEACTERGREILEAWLS
ncbi:ATPase with strong ADP affinity [Neisseria weaveri ATCC 51223]|nr:ATPase with strong ADP affinity [Neisseria weaveri ATCC 51223]